MSLMAAKQNDLIQAVDIHIVMIPSPGGPVPTPLPHPYLGKLDGNLSSDVKIDGMAAATVDSTSTNTPAHIPQGGPFQKPPSNKGTVMMGSATVFINGKPAARMSDMAKTCNDPTDLPVGIVMVPFSTVLIGGPPSVVGSAAAGSGAGSSGAQGGDSDSDAGETAGAAADAAGDGGAGEGDNAEPETSFVEFLVSDKQGNAWADAKYEMILPDGSVEKGSLDGSGKVRKDSVPLGNTRLLLEGLHDASWPGRMALVGEEVTMTVKGVGLPEGANVDFEVFRQGEEGQALATAQGSLQGGIASATFTYSYDEQDCGKSLELIFHAKQGKYVSRSTLMAIGDRLRGRFQTPDGDNAGIVHYVLKLADGQEVLGASDNEGTFEETGLTLGPVVIEPRFGGHIEKA